MLACKEALCVLAMKHNPIPPFLMKEACVLVENSPKVQSKDPTKHHHSTHFTDEDLRMHLMFHGIFSYFSSKKPLLSVLNNYDNKILFLKTDNVNPYNAIYSENE